MVDVSYYLQIIDDVFNCSYLKRNSKIAFIPNAKEKIFLEDMELTVKEVIYLTILKKEFILIRLESIFIKESPDEFCKKYRFEKLKASQW